MGIAEGAMKRVIGAGFCGPLQGLGFYREKESHVIRGLGQRETG